MRNKRFFVGKLVLLFSALALVAAACGGDDDSSDNEEILASLNAIQQSNQELSNTMSEVSAKLDAITASIEGFETGAMDDPSSVTVSGSADQVGDDGEEEVIRPVGEEVEVVVIKAYGGDTTTLDPRRNFELRAGELIANMYDQLTTYALEENADGVLVASPTDVVGLLAESWQFNEDNTQLTFHLRPNVKFHSSDRTMTAEDVKWSFERADQLIEGGWFDHQVIGLTDISNNIEVIDDLTIRFNFDRATPFALQVLSNAGVTVYDSEVMKANATDEDPWASEYLVNNDVGTGPYTLESITPGVQIVLQRFDDYFLGPAQSSRIIFQIVPSEADRAILLGSNEIDFAEGLPLTAIPELENDGAKITSVPSTAQTKLMMNTVLGPTADKNLRQAISWAIPYDDIIDGVYLGYAQRGTGPIPTGTPSHDPNAPFYSFDLDKARAALAESAYPNGVDLTLTIDSTRALNEELAIIVQAALSQIGINVTIEQVAPGAFNERFFADTLEFFIWPDVLSWVNEPTYHMQLFWEQGSYGNRIGYSNPAVNDLLAQAKLLPAGDPERQALYSQVQALMLDDAPAVWLAEPDWVVGTSQDVNSFIHRPDQLTRFFYVSK